MECAACYARHAVLHTFVGDRCRNDDITSITGIFILYHLRRFSFGDRLYHKPSISTSSAFANIGSIRRMDSNIRVYIIEY